MFLPLTVSETIQAIDADIRQIREQECALWQDQQKAESCGDTKAANIALFKLVKLNYTRLTSEAIKDGMIYNSRSSKIDSENL